MNNEIAIQVANRWVLLETNNKELQILNKGFCNDKSIGIFELTAYNKGLNQVLVKKPVYSAPHFIVDMNEYKKIFKEHMSFVLYNN